MLIPFLRDPAPPQILVVPLAMFIFMFPIYTARLYWRAVRNNTSQEQQITYWLDTLWYLAFIAMSSGPASPFSFFLSLPLLFTSLRWGYAAGMRMAVFSSSMLIIIGTMYMNTGASLQMADLLLPPVGLLTLGHLMATWSNSGLALNRRLASLKEINSLFNPRHNIEQMIDRVARHLATLYPIDKYVLLIVEAGRPPRAFRASLPDDMYRLSDAAAVEIVNLLSGLDAKGAVIYCASRGLLPAEVYCSTVPNTVTLRKQRVTEAAKIADRFDCTGFGSVQYNLRQGGTARLFLCSNDRSFGAEDMPFLHQLGDQLSPRIENSQLLDRLASEVAEHERHKISRDMHDSAIQPYIGLKFGLEALARKAGADNPLAMEIGRLVEMATIEITELRRYVKGLRGQEEPGHAALVPAVRRQAARFGELYGIKVVVESAEALRVGDDVANEAFHMVSEALSNIRRHTTASFARINLACDKHQLTLRIINPCDSAIPAKIFTPRSIAERSLALGGTWEVGTGAGNETVVTVSIPLKT